MEIFKTKLINNKYNNSIYKDSFNSKAKILNEEGANQKNKEKKEKRNKIIFEKKYIANI